MKKSLRFTAVLIVCLMFEGLMTGGCGNAPKGNGREGEKLFREGMAAELQGNLDLAQQKYAEACSLHNGNGCRKLAEMALKYDRAALFARNDKDENWELSAKALMERLAHLGEQAAAHGAPMEKFDETLRELDQHINKTLEEARAEKESARLAEEIRIKAAQLAEGKRKALIRQTSINKIRRQIEDAKKQIAEDTKIIENTDEIINLLKKGKKGDYESQVALLYIVTQMGVSLNDPNDAFEFGENVALANNEATESRNMLQKQLPDLEDEVNGLLEEDKIENDVLSALEQKLAELRRQLAGVQRKLTSPTASTEIEELEEDAEAPREAFGQAIFEAMGGDAFVEASDKSLQLLNKQQEVLQTVLERMGGKSRELHSQISPERQSLEALKTRLEFEQKNGTQPVPSQGDGSDIIVATVNGTAITEGDIQNMLDRFMGQLGGQLPPEQLETALPQIRENILNELIMRQIQRDAVAAAGIELTDEEYKHDLDELVEALPEGATIEQYLEESGASDDELREQMKMRRLILRQIESAEKPAEEEIRAFYDENRDGFEQPEAVTASHILIAFAPDDDDAAKAAKRKRIAGIRQQIIDGADFAKMAAANSDCPSKNNGGNLGAFGRGQMVKPVEDAAFSQEIGQIGDIVETPFGYHIIKVTDHQKGKTPDFDDVKDNIAELLEAQRQHKLVEQYLENLKKNARVERFGEFVTSVPGDGQGNTPP